MDNESVKSASASLNFIEILSFMWNKKIQIAVTVAVCTVLALLYSNFFVAPEYESEAKIVVLSSSDTGKITSSDVAVSTYLVTDYIEMVVDRTVLEEVNRELKLNMTYNQLKNCVKVKNPQDSRILEITVTTDNAKRSQQIAGKICEVARVKMVDILGVDKVNIFSAASKPTGDSSTPASIFAIMGVLSGLLLSVLACMLSICLNDKIKNSDDVAKYLDLCTLATIPYNTVRASGKKRSGKRKAVKN